MHRSSRHRQTRCRKRTSAEGFTAIELIVTLSIISILVGLGLPSFQSVMADRKQSSQLANLRKTLVFARSEAIKRAHHVSVCARETNATCGEDWSKGWLVYADADAGTPGVLDADDTILRLTEQDQDTLSVHATAVVRPSPMQSQSNIRFSPRGRTDWSLGTVVLCDQRGEEHALGLIINGAGSLRAAYKETTAGDVVQDATGDAVECT